MGEKLLAWSDPALAQPGDGLGGLSRDQILDQVTLYWVTGTAASSARLYAESIDRVIAWITGARTDTVSVPVSDASGGAAEQPVARATTPTAKNPMTTPR